MKITKEILRSIDIDKYVNFIVDKHIELSKAINKIDNYNETYNFFSRNNYFDVSDFDGTFSFFSQNDDGSYSLASVTKDEFLEMQDLKEMTNDEFKKIVFDYHNKELPPIVLKYFMNTKYYYFIDLPYVKSFSNEIKEHYKWLLDKIDINVKHKKQLYNDYLNNILSKNYKMLDFIIYHNFIPLVDSVWLLNKQKINFEFLEKQFEYRDVLPFVSEFAELKFAQYLLKELDKLEKSELPETKELSEIELPLNKLQWNGNKIELITLFYDLHNAKLLKCNKTDIERLLNSFFSDKNNDTIAKSYVNRIMKKEEPKAKRRINLINFKEI